MIALLVIVFVTGVACGTPLGEWMRGRRDRDAAELRRSLRYHRPDRRTAEEWGRAARHG